MLSFASDLAQGPHLPVWATERVFLWVLALFLFTLVTRWRTARHPTRPTHVPLFQLFLVVAQLLDVFAHATPAAMVPALTVLGLAGLTATLSAVRVDRARRTAMAPTPGTTQEPERPRYEP